MSFPVFLYPEKMDVMMDRGETSAGDKSIYGANSDVEEMKMEIVKDEYIEEVFLVDDSSGEDDARGAPAAGRGRGASASSSDLVQDAVERIGSCEMALPAPAPPPALEGDGGLPPTQSTGKRSLDGKEPNSLLIAADKHCSSKKGSSSNSNEIQPFKTTNKCNICGKLFSWPSSLYRHKRKHKLEDRSLESDHSKLVKDTGGVNSLKVTDKINQQGSNVDSVKVQIEKSQMKALKVGNIDVKRLLTKDNTSGYEKLILDLLLEDNKKGSFQCPVCDKIAESTFYLGQHIASHMNLKPFKCSVCSKRMTRHSDLKKHLNDHKSEIAYVCIDISNIFKKLGPQEKEKDKNGCSKNLTDKDEVSLPFNKRARMENLNGNKCDKPIFQIRAHEGTFHNEKNFRENCELHAKGEMEINDLCRSNCSQAMKYDVQEVRNTFTSRTVQQNYRCTMCPKIFTSKEEFLLHIHFNCIGFENFPKQTLAISLLEPGDKLFNCLVCGEKFAEKQSLHEHWNVHLNVNNFKTKEQTENADLNLKGINNTDKLEKDEIKKDSSKRKHFKDLREQLFQESSDSIINRNITINCNNCGTMVETENALQKHKLCCPKSFSTVTNVEKLPPDLEQDINKQTKKAFEYQCHICSRKLSSLAYLKTHVKVHTRLKPFKCECCGKKYKFQTYLCKHMKLVHGRINQKLIQKPIEKDKSDKVVEEGLGSSVISDLREQTCFKIGDVMSQNTGMISSIDKSKRNKQKEVKSNETVCHKASPLLHEVDNEHFNHTACSKTFSWKKSLESHCNINSKQNIKNCSGEQLLVIGRPDTLIQMLNTSVCEPDTSFERADNSIQRPDASIQNYASTIHKPATSISMSDTSGSSNDKPDTSIHMSKTSNQRPKASIHGSDTSIQRPEISIQRSETSIQELETSIHSSEISIQKSETSIYRPDTSIQSPQTSIEKPSVQILETPIEKPSMQILETPIERPDSSVRSPDTSVHDPDTSIQQPVKCGFCEQSFPTRSKLRKHMLSQTCLGPFECNNCDSKFKYKITLQKHNCKLKEKNQHEVPELPIKLEEDLDIIYLETKSLNTPCITQKDVGMEISKEGNCFTFNNVDGSQQETREDNGRNDGNTNVINVEPLQEDCRLLERATDVNFSGIQMEAPSNSWYESLHVQTHNYLPPPTVYSSTPHNHYGCIPQTPSYIMQAAYYDSPPLYSNNQVYNRYTSPMYVGVPSMPCARRILEANGLENNFSNTNNHQYPAVSHFVSQQWD